MCGTSLVAFDQPFRVALLEEVVAPTGRMPVIWAWEIERGQVGSGPVIIGKMSYSWELGRERVRECAKH